MSQLLNFARHAAVRCPLLLSLTVVGCSPSSSGPAVTIPGTSSGTAGNAASRPVMADAVAGDLQFADRTADSGLDFTNRNGEEAGHVSILESLGGGAALLDFDCDDDADLMVAGGGEFVGQQILGLPPALYRNDGNWRFSEIGSPARAEASPFYSHGVNRGDYDNDGFPDVLITGYGGLVLFHNLGDGTFEEHTAAGGLSDRWSSSSAWGDLNGDGALDLYVAHYVNWSFDNHPECPSSEPGQREVCPPRVFEPLRDVLYVSRQDGAFDDATNEAGLRPDGKGLGVLMADVDRNGWIDVYVANDTVPNFLYRNTGNGTLQEVGVTSGTALNDNGSADGSMGVDLFDFNSDGLPDLFVSNFENESNALYRNLGDCFFQHSSQLTGITALGGLYVGWGTALCDFDRDGDEDAMIANGHVVRYPKNAPLRQRPLLLANDAGRRFRQVEAGPYFAAQHMGRGLAIGDLDDDGDVDAVMVNTNEPVALLSNEARKGRWLGMRLIGGHSNRDAVGALLDLYFADGRILYRQIKGGGSYASTHDRRVWFGLGDAGDVARIEIRWPSGAMQTVSSPQLNRVTTLIEPRGGNPAGAARQHDRTAGPYLGSK